jgi:hypothetical protein
MIVPQKENDKKKAVALGATGTGVGATLIKKTYDKGNLTGRETLFHGTSRDRAKKIKETGLLSKFTGGKRGNTEVLKKWNTDTYEKSLGKVYLTPKKSIGRMFAEITERGGVTNIDFRDKRDILQRTYSPLNNSGVVRVKAPTWKMNVVPNPEAMGSYENFLKAHGINKSDLSKLERFATKSQHNKLSRGTRVIEGDIPSRYIKGSKDYRRTSAKEFKEFVKANPKRFAKGVGATALGVGIAGASLYGAKKMIDRHREMQKEAGIRDFIRRLREKLTRGRAKPTPVQALPAPKPKPDWEIPIREAGRNRQTVEIQYVDRHGAVSTREVEPYEIKDGHFWGYSLDANKPGIRRFNLERIQNIKPTSNTFDPRWEVKLAAAMRKPSRNEGEWGETDFMPDGEDKRLRRAYERLREGNRYTVNKNNLYIKMKLRGGNPYSKQV